MTKAHLTEEEYAKIMGKPYERKSKKGKKSGSKKIKGVIQYHKDMGPVGPMRKRDRVKAAIRSSLPAFREQVRSLPGRGAPERTVNLGMSFGVPYNYNATHKHGERIHSMGSDWIQMGDFGGRYLDIGGQFFPNERRR